jgi:hypothetical protein
VVGDRRAEQDDGMSRVLTVVAGVVALVGFAGFMTRIVRGNPIGVQLIAGSVVAAVVVWFLASGRIPLVRR